MILTYSEIDHTPVRDGEYEFFCGRDLRTEVPLIMAFLKALYLGQSLSVTLHPEDKESLRWIGDGLNFIPRQIRSDSISELVVFTSGTTGSPKAITKSDFKQYVSNKRGRGTSSDRWLLTYNPFRWAGISLLSHVLHHDCSVIIPKKLGVDEILKAARTDLASHISLTPTLFRKMLLQASKSDWAEMSIQQVTFGGEMATQGILDSARNVFPNATITHTYASTEFGDICSASDGREGFDLKKMSKFSFGLDGELFIDGRPTGDLWRLEDERLYFSGRREALINIGGNKIALHVVETAALSVPGVSHAVAGSVPSPLMGQVVTLDYVGEIEPRDLQRELRARLPRFACPASMNRKSEIEINSTGKAKR